MMREQSPDAIQVKGLCKSYGEVRALDGVSFSVRRGELFAYLGPNGAGKTTTISILSGLLSRDSGQLQVCGVDVAQDPVTVKQKIGLVPEESNLYPELSCRRNLLYLGELYGLPREARRDRAAELLALFDLTDRADMRFGALSRGMKRRLTVAAALVHSPEVLFLDEPTSGLDVPSAHQLRTLVRSVNQAGTTVLLTTHNLAEAESLCSRILILIKGQVVAEGTASDISARVADVKRLSVLLSERIGEDELRAFCPAVQSVSSSDGTWILDVTDTHSALAQLMSMADSKGLRILRVANVIPSLEDAFVAILKRHGETGETKR